MIWNSPNSRLTQQVQGPEHELHGERAEEFAERLITIRRHLHRNPELSGEEKETTAAIRSWLEEEGVRIADEYVLRTGLVAEVGQGDGPVVALRADIDALPIQEETKLEFASQVDGKMHACGHDAHTAILIGAARLLKQRESSSTGKSTVDIPAIGGKSNGCTPSDPERRIVRCSGRIWIA